MFSRFFIDRPIVAAVLSIFIVIAGLAAMRVLPLGQYPEIAPPVVTVQAVYPGASAEIVEQEVTRKVEEAVNTIAGINQLFSRSYEGASVVIVQFDLTEGRVYTLSSGTKAVVGKLEAPVKVRLYYSQGSSAVP